MGVVLAIRRSGRSKANINDFFLTIKLRHLWRRILKTPPIISP
jgi:hypothetical protein